MLTSAGYLTGLIVYVGSALLALILANLWFLRWAPIPVRVLISLPLAALLLTPAYFEPGAGTLAPALVVAVFQWFSQGPEAAEHALRPLLLFTAVGLGLGVMLGGVAWWKGWGRTRPDPALDLADDS